MKYHNYFSVIVWELEGEASTLTLVSSSPTVNVTLLIVISVVLDVIIEAFLKLSLVIFVPSFVIPSTETITKFVRLIKDWRQRW